MSKPSREDERCEFKREWTKRALEDLAAFANSGGGELWVGLEDDGTVVGWSPEEGELLAVTQRITDLLGLRPRTSWVTLADREVWRVQVAAHPAPVSLQGRYLTRVGSTNREMSGEQLAAKFVARAGVRWDSLLSDVPVSAVADDAYERFLRSASERLPASSAGSPRELLLENLNLARQGRLTNAGVLLFSGNSQSLFASATLRVGKFEDGVVTDTVDLAGTLFEQFDEAVDAMRKHVRRRYDVGVQDLTAKEMERRDIWAFPVAALREALANALVHRDYSVSGHIEVRFSDEFVQFRSPGLLPEDITPERLLEADHPSRPRNPVIAQAFFYAGLIEKWGTGTTLMLKACAEAGLPEPQFIERSGYFEVRLEADLFAAERLEALGLTEPQVRILLEAKEAGRVTNQRVRALLDVSARTATRMLGELEAKGLLCRKGKTKDAHFVLDRRS